MRNLGLVITISVLCSSHALATGLATCDAGPEDLWRPQAELEEMLESEGWEVRRIKVDGKCYEVYAIDDQGEKVEAYFHPETLERVPTED